jgi:hypothetical protein
LENVSGYKLWHTDVQVNLMKQQKMGNNLLNTDLYIISELLGSVTNLANLANLANASTRQNGTCWEF